MLKYFVLVGFSFFEDACEDIFTASGKSGSSPIMARRRALSVEINGLEIRKD